MEDEENLDETVFNNFATGELDLPEADEDQVDSESEDLADDGLDEDDSELEAYYDELGLDPNEMLSEKAKQKKLYKKQKKEKVIKKVQTEQRKKSDVLQALIDKAKNSPSIQSLTRIIQVVKSVFLEKKEKEAKNGEEDEDMEEKPDAEKAKKERAQILSQQLNSQEYQDLLQFFAQELPTLILTFVGVKEFPKVDKLMQQARYKYTKDKSNAFSVKAMY